MTDPFAPLRDAASAAARNLGFASEPHLLTPEHWQRVLTSRRSSNADARHRSTGGLARGTGQADRPVRSRRLN